jgi:hypothetical protein
MLEVGTAQLQRLPNIQTLTEGHNRRLLSQESRALLKAT